LGEGFVKNSADSTGVFVFSDPRLFSNSRYVLVDTLGYFGEDTRIYNIEDQERLAVADLGQAGFSEGGKYLFYCSNGRGGMREGKVIKAASGNTEFDVFGEVVAPETMAKNNDYGFVKCYYDKDSKRIVFDLFEKQPRNQESARQEVFKLEQ